METRNEKTNESKQPLRILIVGAASAGLTMAFWLSRDGHNLTIVEKSPALRDDGHLIDFFGAGYDVAQQMGIIPDLEAIHYPI